MTTKLRPNPYLLNDFKGSPLLWKTYKKDEPNRLIAIDIGYHGVKIATEEGLAFMPTVVCPRKDIGGTTGVDPRRIAYRVDEQEYFVGDLALHLSQEGDVRKAERYNLNFIKTPDYLALFRSAVYLASKGNPEPLIATGLPSKGFAGDKYYLKTLQKTLIGKHEFEIAVGGDVGSDIKWQRVQFEVKPSNLLIFPQPIGTLASQALTVEDGSLKPINENLLTQSDNIKRTIIDGGFYTIDVQTLVRGSDIQDMSFSLEGKGMIEPYNTIHNKIIELTRQEDFEGVVIPIWQLSQHLEKEEPIIIDDGTDEGLDITKDIEEIYSKYASRVFDIILDREHLNKTIGIEEVYLTGGPTEIFKKEAMNNNRIAKRKLKVVECLLNGIKVEPRFYNVIGYFYLLLLNIGEELTSGDEVAATVEEEVSEE